MGRAPCCEKDSVKRGPWTPEEDTKLLACVAQHGTGSWRTLPKKAGLQRCGKSCRLRWTNYLRPDLKHGQRFSEEEEETIVKLHAALGSRWSLIAAQLPGRTDNDVKNYWNTRLKKKLCEMGIDPITHKPISQLLADLAGSIASSAAPPSFSATGCSSDRTIAEATLACFKDDMLNVMMRPHLDISAASLLKSGSLLPPPPPPPPPSATVLRQADNSPGSLSHLRYASALLTPTPSWYPSASPAFSFHSTGPSCTTPGACVPFPFAAAGPGSKSSVSANNSRFIARHTTATATSDYHPKRLAFEHQQQTPKSAMQLPVDNPHAQLFAFDNQHKTKSMTDTLFQSNGNHLAATALISKNDVSAVILSTGSSGSESHGTCSQPAAAINHASSLKFVTTLQREQEQSFEHSPSTLSIPMMLPAEHHYHMPCLGDDRDQSDSTFNENTTICGFESQDGLADAPTFLSSTTEMPPWSPSCTSRSSSSCSNLPGVDHYNQSAATTPGDKGALNSTDALLWDLSDLGTLIP